MPTPILAVLALKGVAAGRNAHACYGSKPRLDRGRASGRYRRDWGNWP